MAHVHGTPHKETQAGKEIKNREEILALLLAIWLPKRVAVVHWKNTKKQIPQKPEVTE